MGVLVAGALAPKNGSSGGFPFFDELVLFIVWTKNGVSD